MIALFSALGVELPDAPTVIAAAHDHRLAPARHRASRCWRASCPPAGRPACRRSRRSARARRCPPSRFAAHSPKAGLGVALASLAAVLARLFAGGARRRRVALLLGGGVLGLFVGHGAARAAPRQAAGPRRRLAGPRAGGVAGELAGANAVRNPGRTASTAAALMIGLTLVTVVAVLGAGLQRHRPSRDHGPGPRRLRHRRQGGPAVPGRRRATRWRRCPASRAPRTCAPTRRSCRARRADQRHRPGHDRALLQVRVVVKGSERRARQLGSDGAIVTKNYAEDRPPEDRRARRVTTPSGDERTLVVRGIYDPPQAKQLLGPTSA